MVKGLGTDIIEIDRIAKSIEEHGDHFINRLFTPLEQEYCRKFKYAAPHFAGRFAAKEAVAKALGTGFGEQLGWLDIEILGEESGKPQVTFSVKAKAHFNNPKILVSISHSTSYATAVAIWIST
jgi:holo-[acyl-carrier protein] synthase